MIRNLALFSILGLPVIVYAGIITLILLLLTASIGFLNYKGISIIPFKWHLRLAATTITMAVIHAIMGLSLSLDF